MVMIVIILYNAVTTPGKHIYGQKLEVCQLFY